MEPILLVFLNSRYVITLGSLPSHHVEVKGDWFLLRKRRIKQEGGKEKIETVKYPTYPEAEK